jgi:hypothetical protein
MAEGSCAECCRRPAQVYCCAAAAVSMPALGLCVSHHQRPNSLKSVGSLFRHACVRVCPAGVDAEEQVARQLGSCRMSVLDASQNQLVGRCCGYGGFTTAAAAAAVPAAGTMAGGVGLTLRAVAADCYTAEVGKQQQRPARESRHVHVQG